MVDHVCSSNCTPWGSIHLHGRLLGLCLASWYRMRREFVGSGPMAMHQINPQGGKLATLDPIWDRIRSEAEDIVHREPELASFIYSTVLHHNRLEDSVVHRLADRLDHSAMSGDLIRQTYDEALREEPDLGNIFRADLVAVYDRDPATSRFIDPLLYFKGFHALQTHRLAH